MKKLLLLAVLFASAAHADVASDLIGLHLKPEVAKYIGSNLATKASPTFTGTVTVPILTVTDYINMTGPNGIGTSSNIQISSGDLIINSGEVRSNVDSGSVWYLGGTLTTADSGASIQAQGDDLGGADLGGALIASGGNNAVSNLNFDINNASAKVQVRNSSDTALFTVDHDGKLASPVNDLGWTAASNPNTPCTTTCTHAAVLALDIDGAKTVMVGNANGDADYCLCAGPN